MGMEKGNFDFIYFIYVVWKNFCQKFIYVEVVMIGVNFVVVFIGEIVVCINEGNVDMGIFQFKLQIVVFGMEKIVLDCELLGVFICLLVCLVIG